MKSSPTARTLDAMLRAKASSADINTAMAEHLSVCAGVDRELAKAEAVIAGLREMLARMAGHAQKSALPSAAPHVDGPRAADMHAAGGAVDVHEAAIIPLRPDFAPPPTSASDSPEQHEPPPALVGESTHDAAGGGVAVREGGAAE